MAKSLYRINRTVTTEEEYRIMARTRNEASMILGGQLALNAATPTNVRVVRTSVAAPTPISADEALDEVSTSEA